MPAGVYPSCGETDDLAGDRTGNTIVITCGACGTRWDREMFTSDHPVPGDPSQTGHRALRDRRTD